MLDYSRLKSEIEESNAFILPNGTKIKSLAELSDSLLSMEDGFFSEHVNSEKNDFATWISHCFEDELLAERIRHLKTKQEISYEIKTRLEQLRIAETLKNPNFESIQKQEKLIQPQLESNPEPNLDSALDIDLESKPEMTPEPLPEHIPDDNLEPSLESSLEPSFEPSLDSALDSSLETSIEPQLEKALEPKLNQTIEDTIKPSIESLVSTKDSKQIENKIENNNPTPNIIDQTKLEEVKLEINIDQIKKIETVQTPIIINQKVDNPSNKIEETIKPKDDGVISEDDKRILETDNKLLSPAQLFKKLKLQKIFGRKEKIETNTAEVKPIDVKPTISEAKESLQPLKQEKEEYNLQGLTQEETTLFKTENSKLSFKDLFKKLKLQKERKVEKSSQASEIKKDEIKIENGQEPKISGEKTLESKPGEIKKAKEAPPVDLLNLTEEEFHTLIGINLNDELIATVSKEHIVKIKERRKLKTGVPGFDDLLDKGIPEGSSILVSGGAGSGKTTFSIQQLGWAAEHGEKCLFISLEEDEERLVEHMKDYGLNPEKYLRKNLLKIKKLDSFKLARSVEALLAHARGELMIDIEPVLDIIPDGYKPDRVVLDSLSSIAAAFAGRPEEYRIYVEQLFKIFERVGATSFIITEIQGAEASGHGGVEDFLADGVVNFYNMRKGNIRQPAMEVFKMRGTRHKKKIVPFNFVSGKGIEIYPLEEVFHEL